MEDIFCQASLCYLTNRCDEGFQLILSVINSKIDLNWEEQEVFCLISMNIIEKRYKSWMNIHQILIQTDNLKQRHLIEIYLEIISKEFYFYSQKILLLIKNYLYHSLLSSQNQMFYLKIQGDIYFFLSQISNFELKLENIHLTLNFYDQALELCSQNSFYDYYHSTIVYNKALVLIFLTEEYDLAKDMLKQSLNFLKTNSEKLKLLLNYCENI